MAEGRIKAKSTGRIVRTRKAKTNLVSALVRHARVDDLKRPPLAVGHSVATNYWNDVSKDTHIVPHHPRALTIDTSGANRPQRAPPRGRRYQRGSPALRCPYPQHPPESEPAAEHPPRRPAQAGLGCIIMMVSWRPATRTNSRPALTACPAGPSPAFPDRDPAPSLPALAESVLRQIERK